MSSSPRNGSEVAGSSSASLSGELLSGIEQFHAGRHALALEHFSSAADEGEPEAIGVAEALAASACLELGRPYEAIAWVERMRDPSGDEVEADLLEAAAYVALGEGQRALDLLQGIDALQTPHMAYPEVVVRGLRCEAYGLAELPDPAVAEALAALRIDPALPQVWRVLVALAAGHDIDLGDAVAEIPDAGLLETFAWVAESPASGLDKLLEAIWDREPGDRRVLAMVATAGHRFGLPRAVEWSGRLREAGLAAQCPVLAIAAERAVPCPQRIQAAAIAHKGFGDERAIPLLELASVELADGDVRDVLAEVMSFATDEIVDTFIATAATTPTRCLILASDLLDRGASAAAEALTRHALELSTGQPEVCRGAAEDELGAATVERLIVGLRSHGADEVADAFATALGSPA